MALDAVERDIGGGQTRQPGILAFSFRLPRPTLTLNVWQRMSPWKRTRYARDLAWEIRIAYGEPLPFRPLERARLVLLRHGIQAPDTDGLIGGCKPLIDCLLAQSARHPHGLGFIVDDSSDRLRLVAEHVQVRHLRDQCTVVEIWTI